MDFEAQDVWLRDGRAARLRRVGSDDAPALRELDAAVVAAGQGVVKLPEEVGDAAYWEAKVGWWSSHPDSLHIVADLDGQLVGSAELRRHDLVMIRHVALFTLQVHPVAQGAGLGRALLEATLRSARSSDIARIELYVLADNVRAVRLYRSVGFQETHRREGFLRRPGGETVADIGMAWTRGAPDSW